MALIRRSLLIAVIAVVPLGAVTAATAAAPRHIVVSGRLVERPVVLSDWDENFRLLHALADGRRAPARALCGLRVRPRLRLTLFWGWPESRPPPTKPNEANSDEQFGWLYPAFRGHPAMVHILLRGNPAPRILTTRAAEIFARHRVPVRTRTSAAAQPFRRCCGSSVASPSGRRRAS